MLFFGSILFLLGVVSTIFGITKNNDAEAQLEYLFEKGKTNPGTIFIIIGVLLILAGAALIIYHLYSLQKIRKHFYEDEYHKRHSESVQNEKDLLNNGGWKCVCGTVNASYVSSCSCGKTKREIIARQASTKKKDVETTQCH